MATHSPNRKAKLAPAPPRKRDWKVRQVYHVYQRGSRRQRVFQARAELIAYLRQFDRLARRYRVRVHAFSLASHYVHFLLEPLTKWGISHLMQHLQSHHARRIHQSMGVTGHLWRNHFHAKPITSARQYRATLVYIEQDSATSGQVPRAHLYDYSSAPAHAANQPIHELRHRSEHSQVRLYLTRWRREFPNYRHWPEHLRSPRDPAHAQEIAEIERILGSDRRQPPRLVPLPQLQTQPQTAAAPQAPHTSHGWTRR